MRQRNSPAFRLVWKELERWGVLLASDAKLPSVAGLVARAPLRGSWWAHPQSHEIFGVASRLGSRPDVLMPRLIGGKVTFLHKKLWPALLAVGRAREPWQLEGLTERTQGLRERVENEGVLRTDELTRETGERAKSLGEAARELERRLLVYGEQFHTESGAHAKRLESWEHLTRRLRLKGSRMSKQAAKKKLEKIAAALEGRFHSKVRLPWRDPKFP